MQYGLYYIIIYVMKDISQSDIQNNIPLVSRVENWLVEPMFIAGPCTVENIDQLQQTAKALKASGIKYMRAGAYKPMTFPYRNNVAYELREHGLSLLKSVKEEYEIKIVTEVVDLRTAESVAQVADIIQIGTRNMYNYPLLETVAQFEQPILLKRHFGASLRDWLGATEYILKNGNDRVILCERGVVAPHTHETTSRFIADVQAIPAVKMYTNLPVIIDPSHATFNRNLVPSITYAGMAAGADGFIIEAHPTPEIAAVDPLNAIPLNKLKGVVDKSKRISKIINE